MKLVKLTQAKIEGESEPKVFKVGECYMNIDEVTIVHSVIDKYDVPIKNVCGIRTRQGEGYYIFGEPKDIAEQIEQSTFA